MSVTIYSPQYIRNTSRSLAKSLSKVWWIIYVLSCEKDLKILDDGYKYIIATDDKKLLMLWEENKKALNNLMIDLQRLINNDFDSIFISNKSASIYPELSQVIMQGFKSDPTQNDPAVIKAGTKEMLERQSFWDEIALKGYVI